MTTNKAVVKKIRAMPALSAKQKFTSVFVKVRNEVFGPPKRPFIGSIN